MTLPVDTPLGQLEIVEVYLYYDGPKLFICRNSTQQLYLANWIEGGKENTWLYVALSFKRLRQLQRGEISLHDAFLLAENDYVYLVKLSNEDSLLDLLSFRGRDLPPEWLPIEGEFLERTDDDSLLEHGASAAAAIAKMSGREVLFMRLYDNEPLRQGAPAQGLGQLLLSLQGSVNAFAQSLSGRTTARGTIPGELLSASELSVVETYAGSFGVHLASTAGVNPSKESLAGDAIEELITLIDVGSDAERLRVRLSKLRRRAASRYRALLAAIVAANTDFQVNWGSVKAGRGRSAKLAIGVARDALSAIQNIETNLTEILQVEGVLIGINIRTKYYEITSRVDGKKYSGAIATEAVTDVQHATINESYSATLRLRTDTNPITGEERSHWDLTSLKHL
jgi:hypothetical protein